MHIPPFFLDFATSELPLTVISRRSLVLMKVSLNCAASASRSRSWKLSVHALTERTFAASLLHATFAGHFAITLRNAITLRREPP